MTIQNIAREWSTFAGELVLVTKLPEQRPQLPGTKSIIVYSDQKGHVLWSQRGFVFTGYCLKAERNTL